MARSVALLLAALGWGLLGEGCAAAPATTVRRPSPLNERAARTPRRPAEPPPLVAPPPAYGNKIVLARAEPATAVN